MKKLMYVVLFILMLVLTSCTNQSDDEIIIDPDLKVLELPEGEIEINPTVISEGDYLGLSWTCYDGVSCAYDDGTESEYLSYSILSDKYVLQLPSEDYTKNEGFSLVFENGLFYVMDLVGNHSENSILFNESALIYGDSAIELTENQISIFIEYNQLLNSN